jgi:ankyrin repeat protein
MELLLTTQDTPEWWLSSAFLNSVAQGNIAGPTWLLENGLNANATSESGYPLLSCIVQQSPANPDIIESLLSHGALCLPEAKALIWLSGYSDFQHELAPGRLAEHIEERLCRLLSRLVDKGANIDAVDDQGRTALHWAVLYRSPEYVNAVLALDADVDAQDENGESALFCAVASERSEKMAIIRQLTLCGANPKLPNNEGNTPISISLDAEDRTLLKMLMLARKGRDKKPDANAKREDLVQAAAEGNLGRIKRVLAKGVDINQRDAKGCTAILRAAGAGHAGVVSTLIASGANLNLAAKNGTTPIGAAVLGNHREIAQMLVDHGVDVGQPQLFGISPLMLAAARWYSDMAASLLKMGADIDGQDEAQGSALMAAVQNALLADDASAAETTVETLLKAGADVNAANDEGQTALMLLVGARAQRAESANTRTITRLARLLLDAGADPNTRDLSGWSALHATAAHGFLEPATLLIDSGANRRLRDINGLSPNDLAMENNHVDLVDLFMRS